MIDSTIAETYLRGRGITCDLPETLRFHPECWHGATAKRLPAMIARVDGLPRFAVHRTYLRPDGSGKAGVDPNKAMLGRTAGGAVRLCGGDGPLVVAEGIETALSLASGLIRRPANIWAALSAPGIGALQLPDRPHRLTIAPDGDTAGREAANRLAERAAALGWTVSLLPAPDGRDWNDILMTKGAAA
ncbi:MAG: toprim domain-containing protein [Paracoccaceae bacterium]